MAKAKTAEAGDNSGFIDDEAATLQAYFASKIRAQQKVAALKKAEYDSERDAVNALFTQARGELRITRKEFEEVLALQDMTEAEFLRHEQKRNARMANGGLPVGTQLDMFPQDAATEQGQAHADGKRAGLRGDDPVPPSHVTSMLHPDWMRGWTEGQDEIGQKMIAAMTILNERKAKTVALEPEPAEEEGDEDEEDGVDADLKALEAKGWTQPTADEEIGAAA